MRRSINLQPSPRKPVPLRKAIGILILGFASGFCVVTAVLTLSDTHQFTVKVAALFAGALLAVAAALLLNRFL